MADWFAVYHDPNGELVSTGTVIADPLPPGLSKKQLAGPPGDQVWDTGTLNFIAGVVPSPIDRVAEFLANLPPNKRGNAVEAEITRLLGPFQFRTLEEGYEL